MIIIIKRPAGPPPSEPLTDAERALFRALLWHPSIARIVVMAGLSPEQLSDADLGVLASGFIHAGRVLGETREQTLQRLQNDYPGKSSGVRH